MKVKVREESELEDVRMNDPENADDVLPQPYALIDKILQETVLFRLGLRMHEIELTLDIGKHIKKLGARTVGGSELRNFRLRSSCQQHQVPLL